MCFSSKDVEWKSLYPKHSRKAIVNGSKHDKYNLPDFSELVNK